LQDSLLHRCLHPIHHWLNAFLAPCVAHARKLATTISEAPRQSYQYGSDFDVGPALTLFAVSVFEGIISAR
jgi:hypothetical protein